MEDYLGAGIKSVIETFPEVGVILDHYGIGCVPCTVGTCKLGDVLKLHALPPDDQAQMIKEIEMAVQQGPVSYTREGGKHTVFSTTKAWSGEVAS